MNIVSSFNLLSRIQGRYQRSVGSFFYKRLLLMRNTVPYISFTFDDFPRSALHSGGNILGLYKLRATYYASLGLMGEVAPTGRIFDPEDLKELLSLGHELGCHTFDHCHSWKTKPRLFEDSIIKNKQALNNLLPGAVFRSFSYPILGPRPKSKRMVSKYFESCRAGGQTFNVGVVDLNLLKAFFIEKSISDPQAIKSVIDRNRHAKGWLIFATHDICNNPTRFGCTPSFFEDVVRWSLDSGAKILPVVEALKEIAVNFNNKRE